ncbi:MAG: hydroxyacylglutathione hydrolase [Sphingomonadales bacterium]
MSLEIVQVALLVDNYAYLLREPVSGLVAILDPSVADKPLIEAESRGWAITHVLNTHHHWDHTGGNLGIKAATGAKIVGPAYEKARIPGIDIPVSEEAPFNFGETSAEILFVPGHTRGQISFWFKEEAAVFVGDTLFGMGCGRLFEGTPQMMFESMQKLKKLPGDTKVYCGHEYTEANGEFALTVDPDNPALHARLADVRALRAEGKPTVPFFISEEKTTNPFFLAKDVATFAEVRAKKDKF